MEKKKTVFLVIGIVLAAVILAVGIYQIYLESQRTSAPPTAQAQAQAAVSATAAAAPETEPVSQPSWHTCPVCGGSGGTWEYTYNGYGMVVGSYFSPCPNCSGSRQVFS